MIDEGSFLPKSIKDGSSSSKLFVGKGLCFGGEGRGAYSDYH